MKKFFLFAAAVVAAMTVNAKVYDFSKITKNDVETTLTIVEEMKNDSATGKLLIEVPADEKVYAVRLFDDIVLHYASKEKKNIVVDTKNGYFEFPGNGANAEGKALVTVEGLTIGDTIKVEAANKGTGTVALAAIADCAGEEVALPAKANGTYTWVTGVFVASNSDATFSAPSARVRKIVAGAAGTQAIDNVNDAVKAEKFFRNGQLIIRKNGVEYNALGAQL